METGWDGAAGAVTVKGEVKAPTTPETPKTDYSTWTAEEEKAYQEFKGLWTAAVEKNDKSPIPSIWYFLSCNDLIKLKEISQKNGQDKMQVISIRYSNELTEEVQGTGYVVSVCYRRNEEPLWTDDSLNAKTGTGWTTFRSYTIDAL